MAKSRRARDVRKAHSMGLTYRGYRQYKSGQSLHLSEKSNRGIRKEASRLTKDAYAPAYAELGAQDKRIRDLQAKRDADNAAFAQWVASRSDALRAEAIRQANATRDRLAQGQNEFATQLQNIRDSASANLQRQGVNTPMGGAAAAQVGAHQAAGQASTLAASNAATAAIGARTQGLESTLANNAAVVAAGRAKDFQDTLKQLQGVADDRQKLVLQQAADGAKAVQSLMDREVTKAQAVIAAGQFGQKLDADNFNKRQTRATTKRGQDVTRQNAKDRLAADQGKVNKYGYSNEQWKRFSPSHRKRIMKTFDDTGGKSKGKAGHERAVKGRAKARQNLSTYKMIASGTVKSASGQQVPGDLRKPGKVEALQGWLVGQGVPSDAALVAAFTVIYPGAPLNKHPKVNRAWKNYVKTQTGSR